MALAHNLLWIVPGILALVAGWLDFKTRRIPNWLTVPGLLLGIALNATASQWMGTREALLGALLGLGVLLPFVLIRSLGAGDWKLVGAIGSFVGPQRLIALLMATLLMAGLMAVVLVIRKKRVQQTSRNLWRLIKAMATFRVPDPELTLDNPQSVKVPFGVAVALVVVLYSIRQAMLRI
jgi:prepilin peptidase CpaA